MYEKIGINDGVSVSIISSKCIDMKLNKTHHPCKFVRSHDRVIRLVFFFFLCAPVKQSIYIVYISFGLICGVIIWKVTLKLAVTQTWIPVKRHTCETSHLWQDDLKSPPETHLTVIWYIYAHVDTHM